MALNVFCGECLPFAILPAQGGLSREYTTSGFAPVVLKGSKMEIQYIPWSQTCNDCPGFGILSRPSFVGTLVDLVLFGAGGGACLGTYGGAYGGTCGGTYGGVGGT